MADDFTISEHRELTTNERAFSNGYLKTVRLKLLLLLLSWPKRKWLATARVAVRVINWRSVERLHALSSSTILCDAEGHSPEGSADHGYACTLVKCELSELEVITDYDVDVCTIPAPSKLEPIRWNAT